MPYYPEHEHQRAAPRRNPTIEFQPYRPPWYPHDDNPWTIISNMSNNIVTNYSRWEDSLPPGELLRLIREHQNRRI